jgi:hypothetical protein
MVLEKRVPISSVSKASYVLGVLMPKHNALGAIRGHFYVSRNLTMSGKLRIPHAESPPYSI